MTISSATRKAGPFLGNGVTNLFPFTFKVFLASDLQVIKTLSTGVDLSPLTLNSDYSVALNSDQNANPGGTITYPLSGALLQTAEKLTATGVLGALQATHITNGGNFFANNIEDQMDYLTILVQQLVEQMSRVALASSSDVGPVLSIGTAVQRALKYITFDASGNLSLATSLPSGTLSRASVGSLLYPQTVAELAASVVPTDYGYAPLNPFRYGADGTGGVNDVTARARVLLVQAQVAATAGIKEWQNGLAVAAYPQTAAEAAASIVPTDYRHRPYTFLRYGLDPTGVSDSTAAINNCFLAAAQANHAKVYMGVSGALVKVNGTINWPVDKCGCDWEGAWLDCTGKTANTVTLQPTSTFADVTTRVGLIKSHPMENFVAMGPVTQANQASYTSDVFILFQDNAVNVIAGVTIRNGGSYNFYKHAQFLNGAFFEHFDNWEFGVVVFNATNGFTKYFVDMSTASTNSGERNSFSNCFFAIAASSTGTVMLNQGNNNADTYFKNCSFDAIGTSARLMTITAGEVYLDDCHLEGSGDTDKWFALSGSNSVLAWDQLTIVVDGAKTAFSLFDCDSTVSAGCMVMGTTMFVSATAYTVPLISGTGRVQTPGTLAAFGGGTAPQYISSRINLISDGGFVNNSLARDGWAVSGAAPPTLSNTAVPAGATNSLKITCATGQNNIATLTRACKPGQIVTMQCNLEATVFTGSGATAALNLNFLDAGGDVLQTIQLAFPGITTTVGVFTTYPPQAGGGTYASAPAGTVNVQLSLNVSGGTITGSPILYASNFILNVT